MTHTQLLQKLQKQERQPLQLKLPLMEILPYHLSASAYSGDPGKGT